MNTGIICYRNINTVQPFLEQVHNTVLDLGQPECQIIWAALSQKMKDEIQGVEWEELNPGWKVPDKSFMSKVKQKIRHILR
jgi:hypothetical protein